MIKIENTIKDKVSQINSSNNVNQYLNIKLEQENNKDSKTTITKSKNQDIYKTIRKKASIINSDQRNIQDKISLIQAQEQKISQIENTLKYARKEYEQAIKSEKKEEVKQKIKIRQLSNKIDNLKNQSQEKQSKIEEINNDKENYLEDEEKIINRINELLEKISNLDFAYIAIEEPKLYYVIIYYIVVFLYMIYKEAKTIKEQSHELQGYYK